MNKDKVNIKGHNEAKNLFILLLLKKTIKVDYLIFNA